MSGPASASSLELIVVRTPNWLGDTVMALPMLAALRAARPGARIILIGRWATLLAGQGVADALLPYPKARAARRHLASAISRERPDIAVLLPSSFESAFAAWRWGARRCIAYATDGRGLFLTDALPLPSPRLHQVDEYGALLAPLGIADCPGEPQWTLAKSSAADAEVDELLAAAGRDGEGPLVGLHLGAAFGSSKLWPAEAYGRLARLLTDDGLRPVLLGTSDDAATATAVGQAAGMPVASLVGRDRVALLPRLLGRLRCLVSGDTGVAHLAAAVGVATVTMFGPSDRRLTAPRGAAARILDREVPCSPCFRPTCPIDHICLRRIEPETVLREVRAAVA